MSDKPAADEEVVAPVRRAPAAATATDGEEPVRTRSGHVRRQAAASDTTAVPVGSADPPPQRSRSFLERTLGITAAPIDLIGGSKVHTDLPERSPVGALRSVSGLNRRPSQLAKQKAAAAAAAGGHEPTAAGGATAPDAQDESEGTPWHIMPLPEMYQALETRREGLTAKERADALVKHGANIITPTPPIPIWMRFLKSLIGGFQLMMMVGSILCFIVYGIDPTDYQTLTLAIMLVVAILLTAIFQTYQEGKADDVMEALKALAADKCHVLIGGEWTTVDASTLVPGDIVEVRGGDKVPADVRVLEAADLKVNNSSLTGENVDIKLGPDANHRRIFEAKNVARSGCNFTNGKGQCIVFATGDNTFFGQIAKSTTQMERPDTLMKREVHRLIIYMSVVAGVLGVVFLILALTYPPVYKPIEAIVFVIAIIVANVPEGLLPQLTVALALTAGRLFDRQCLVSNLEIVETLGAVSVICSDKTGTLTLNQMTVTHVVYNGMIHDTDHAPRLATDTFGKVDGADPYFKQLQRIATLCSDATFSKREGADPMKWTAKGDASESAIIKFVQPFRDIMDFRATHARKCTIPFNSSNKFMLAVHEQEGPEKDTLPVILMMKGAPERIFDRCTQVVENGELVTFDGEMRKKWEGLNSTLAKRGERVLAFAHLELDRRDYPPSYVFDPESETPNFPMNGLTLVGLTSLIDPPRPSVPGAIKACFDAHIKVFMVTGDHPITALAISKSLGLVTKPTAEELIEAGQPVPEDYHGAIAIHGSDMLKFTDADWDRVLKYDEIVFARTMPQQKQSIVVHLNKLGYIVAMTGDGVNDAPALKAANVGVAMGSGAQVAKEAGQIIIMDDDFSTIVQGIREGRQIFENMKKAISYVLASNIPEIIPFLLFIVGRCPLAIETLVILCIDLGTDIMPAVALAYEEPEDAIMMRPPRTANDHLVSLQLMVVSYGTIGVFQTIAAYHAFFTVFADAGFDFYGLWGVGPEYRKKVPQITSTDQLNKFRDLCRANTMWKGNCTDDVAWRDYRVETLQQAQAAFFLTVVWGQIGNGITRKTQFSSAVLPERMLHNKALLISMLVEIIVVLLLTYVPGLNEAFGMSRPSSLHSCVGLWIIPCILLWEEARKALIRRSPHGIIARLTYF